MVGSVLTVLMLAASAVSADVTALLLQPQAIVLSRPDAQLQVLVTGVRGDDEPNRRRHVVAQHVAFTVVVRGRLHK